jgi:DNA-3-methyladenine glycosylase I
MKRCDWVFDDIHIKYHDNEWGVPLHNDRKLFEFLVLDGMQSGLSWKIILSKRNLFRQAFDNFDPKKISAYKEKDVCKLLANEGIIRNRRKIESAINNSKIFLETKKEFGSFDSYVWSFVNYKTKKNSFRKWSDIPATTKESEAMSDDMRKRGFTFVGPTVCYAFMQTVGMINDHLVGCFRRNEI